MDWTAISNSTPLTAHANPFERTSKIDFERKKQTSNSRKKLTCPKITGTASVLAQANAWRTGPNSPTMAWSFLAFVDRQFLEQNLSRAKRTVGRPDCV